MEMALNLAWMLCSLLLVWFWMRNTTSNSVPRRMQMLALALVVLMLLPVISLSDDLMAMQGPAETDTSMRRALHPDEGHPSVVPVMFAQAEAIFTAMPWSGYTQVAVQSKRLAPFLPLLTRSLDRRPPPSQA